MAKKHIAGKGVKFEDVDVSQDTLRAVEMVQKSGQMGVPVTEIDGKIIVGYQPQMFDSLLS
jgi:glutaredoxin